MYNLIRNELSVLERGENLEKRKMIYEELYPETKAKIGKELAEQRWNNATTESVTASKPNFVDSTSKLTGKSE